MLTVRGNIRVTGNLNLKPGIAAAPGTSYLLDDLSAAPDVIMSPSKIFSSTYETAAMIRLRRTSDNAEADFTGAEIAAGDDLTWIGAQTSFVRYVYDQSGNSKDLGQATAGYQGQYTDASGNRIAMSDGNPAPQQIFGMTFPALGFTGTSGAAVLRLHGGSAYNILLRHNASMIYGNSGDSSSAASALGTPVIKINGTTLSPYTAGALYSAITGTDVTVRITGLDWSANSDWNRTAGAWLSYRSDPVKISSVALYNTSPSSADLDLIVSAFEAT